MRYRVVRGLERGKRRWEAGEVSDLEGLTPSQIKRAVKTGRVAKVFEDGDEFLASLESSEEQG